MTDNIRRYAPQVIYDNRSGVIYAEMRPWGGADGWVRWGDYERLAARVKKLEDLLGRAIYYVEEDVAMQSSLTRHAPLPPGEQARHDSTEQPSEKLLMEILEYTGWPGRLAGYP